MARADIVVFAVPLHLTVEIIRELAPLARSSQLLIDLTSLKVLPVKQMLASNASVLGLHPMFGGRYSSFEGQTLVACPVRIKPSHWMLLRTLFESRGMHVKEATPEEHDRMMSIIQVLFHMTTMLTGRVMRELGVDIFETLDYTSPSYRLEITILGRIFAQSSALYSAITQMNPYTASIIRELREGLACYQEWYDDKRLDAFMKDFEKSARHLGDFCVEAYQESSDLLSYAVQLADGKKKRKENVPDGND
jgi:prephenate dehydrogenase